MVNILFVCTGDTCRSTMASAIMKSILHERGERQISCSSAGLFVGREQSINPLARASLVRLGVSVPRHRATQLTEDLIKKNRFVLTMTNDQKSTILNRFPNLMNVFSLSEFVGVRDILDPYGKGEAEYWRVCNEILQAVQLVVNKLTK